MLASVLVFAAVVGSAFYWVRYWPGAKMAPGAHPSLVHRLILRSGSVFPWINPDIDHC